MSEAVSSGSGSLRITIRSVAPDRPWAWLSAGWRDFQAVPGVALAYGALFVVGSFLLTLGLWLLGLFYLVLPLGAGFMLVGPVLAVGLYEVSRKLSYGIKPTLGDAVTAWRANPGQIMGVGVVLMLLLLAWIRLAFLIFALFFGAQPPSWELLISSTLLSAEGLPFLVMGTLVGGVLAALTLAISVISIPLLLDRDVNAITAVLASLKAVARNPLVMIGWGALVTLFIGAGIAVAYVGLLVTFPLIGFASWHAYRDLVEIEEA